MSDYFETMQKLGRDRFEAPAAASSALARDLEAVAEDQQNCSKKYFQDAQAYVRKLLDAKSFDEALETHAEFLQVARRQSWSQTHKLNDLYFNFARKLVRPSEGAVTKLASESFPKSKAA